MTRKKLGARSNATEQDFGTAFTALTDAGAGDDGYVKKMTLRIDETTWQELREAAHRESTPDRRVSMHDIMLEGLELALQERRKGP